MLQYRKEQRILAATMRQELTQVVTSGALLIDGERAEELAQGRTPAATAPITQVFRSLLIASPEVDRIYVLGVKPDGDPRFLLGQGVKTDTDPGSVLSLHARDVLERGVPITTQVYEDSDGKWFSAFHPLRDRQGKVVAVLGADQRASDLRGGDAGTAKVHLAFRVRGGGRGRSAKFLSCPQRNPPLEIDGGKHFGNCRGESEHLPEYPQSR